MELGYFMKMVKAEAPRTELQHCLPLDQQFILKQKLQLSCLLRSVLVQTISAPTAAGSLAWINSLTTEEEQRLLENSLHHLCRDFHTIKGLSHFCKSNTSQISYSPVGVV